VATDPPELPAGGTFRLPSGARPNTTWKSGRGGGVTVATDRARGLLLDNARCGTGVVQSPLLVPRPGIQEIFHLCVRSGSCPPDSTRLLRGSAVPCRVCPNDFLRVCGGVRAHPASPPGAVPVEVNGRSTTRPCYDCWISNTVPTNPGSLRSKSREGSSPARAPAPKTSAISVTRPPWFITRRWHRERTFHVLAIEVCAE
jgi:hypothetical protein